MKNFLEHFYRLIVLFLIGGISYMGIELLWRQRTHWTMGIVGGLCFVLIGLINECFTFCVPLWKQDLIATAIVTVVEFVSGIIINIICGLNVWDYSNVPFNLMGQICLSYVLLWFLLSNVAIVIDDVLRWKLFHEEKPHYHWKEVHHLSE